jgi:hypothetical protein
MKNVSDLLRLEAFYRSPSKKGKEVIGKEDEPTNEHMMGQKIQKIVIICLVMVVPLKKMMKLLIY